MQSKQAKKVGHDVVLPHTQVVSRATAVGVQLPTLPDSPLTQPAMVVLVKLMDCDQLEARRIAASNEPHRQPQPHLPS